MGDARSSAGSSSSASSSKAERDKNNASLNALSSLSQFGALGMSPQQSMQAAMNAFAASNPAAAAAAAAAASAAASGGKSGKDYMSSGILSAALEGNDHQSLLGVRLPPDTEIIKYTSSIVGPKIPGTTSRGRKKTISDEQQQQQLLAQQQLQQQQQLQKQELDATTNALSSLLAIPGLSPAKRARLEMEYAAMAAAVNVAQQQQHQ
ncbi:PREDICTED: AF4/FMR2 family member 4-like, partial [Rhagoletis zephyria]